MRIAILLLMLCLGGATSVMAAGFEGPGAGPAAGMVTRAADVADAYDDVPCILEGHLVEKLPQRKDRYVFRDESGSVVVEIEDETFGHLTVTPQTRIRIVGQVEWSSKRPNEVEVEGLEPEDVAHDFLVERGLLEG